MRREGNICSGWSWSSSWLSRWSSSSEAWDVRTDGFTISFRSSSTNLLMVIPIVVRFPGCSLLWVRSWWCSSSSDWSFFSHEKSKNIAAMYRTDAWAALPNFRAKNNPGGIPGSMKNKIEWPHIIKIKQADICHLCRNNNHANKDYENCYFKQSPQKLPHDSCVHISTPPFREYRTLYHQINIIANISLFYG